MPSFNTAGNAVTGPFLLDKFPFYVSYVFSRSIPYQDLLAPPIPSTLFLSSPILSSTSFSSPVEFYLFSDFLFESPFSQCSVLLCVSWSVGSRNVSLFGWKFGLYSKEKHCFRYIKNNFQLVAKGTDEVCMHVHIQFPFVASETWKTLEHTGSALVQTDYRVPNICGKWWEESAK